MGVVWGASDWESNYNFKLLSPGGVKIGPTPVEIISEHIAGTDGNRYFNAELMPRQIVLRGIMSAANQATLWSNLVDLEDEVIGSLVESDNPSTYASPTRTEKSLTIPGHTGVYNHCVGTTFEFEEVGDRMLDATVIITVTITQNRPFLSSS